jgi:RHS repeat-associated protein
MAGGQGQRDAAIALKDTFGNVADDISSKAADFHEITAAASVDGAHAFGDVDTQFGGTFDGIGQGTESVPKPSPDDGVSSGGGVGGDGETGPVDDNFQGTGEGGQEQEGNSGTSTCKDPVDPISGQMLCTQTDVDLPGILPLLLRRSYASAYRHGTLFGPGWSSTLDQRLVIDQDGIHFLGDDAQQLDYPVPTQPGQKVLPAAGARWPLAWDRKLDGIAITDPATGWTRHFAPPPRGAVAGKPGRETRYLARITDRNGNWLAITRDGDSVPTRVDHFGGYRIEIDSSYRAGGFRVEALRMVPDSGEQSIALGRFEYDPAGRLVEITDTSGTPYIYEYDDRDRITAWIDQTGYRYEYRYDESGRVGWAGGQDGTLSGSFEYDDAARVTRVADSFENVTEYHYDARRHLTKIVDPLGAVTATLYDRFGRLVEQTDPLGHTTRFTLTEQGRPTRVEQADGSVFQAEYNVLGQPTLVVAADGRSWSYAYDEHGNLLNATDPSGGTAHYGYRENGSMSSETDALGRTHLIESNRAGLPVAITDPDGSTWQLIRDGLGRQIQEVDPLGALTSTAYDGEGRPVSRTYADGSREAWEWNAVGDLQSHTDQAGFTTGFTTGPFHKITARREPDGTTHRFTHDAELRLVKVENPQQRAWTYTFDVAGNLVEEQDFNGHTLRYEVDHAGQVLARVNGAGQRIEFERDALGRLVALRADGQEAVFEYDAGSNLRHARNESAEISYMRDALGRVTAESMNGRSVKSVYDAVGQRVEITTPGGLDSTWHYGAAGQPLSVAMAGQQLNFGYDSAGRESYRWISPQTAMTQVRDRLGRTTARQLLRADSAVDPDTGQAAARLLEQRSWTYQADGTPSAVDDSFHGPQSFQLDARRRITAVQAATWSEACTYDAAGNLTQYTDSRIPDSGTAGPREVDGTLLRTAGRSSYQYDGQGRLIKAVRRTLSGGSKAWTYKYDSFDRLIEATNPRGETWRYGYDPLGRRTSKQRFGADGAPAEEHLFSWDGPYLIQQDHLIAGHATSTSTTWTYEPDTFTPIAQTTRTLSGADPATVLDEQFHAIVADLVGTPTELVTPDGEVHWRRHAGVWGMSLGDREAAPEAVPTGAGPISCPLRFPGQFHDDETGLDYNLHRYYDPATGRYLTPDPLGLTPGPNHHAYVDNPLQWLDPLGLAGTECEVTVYHYTNKDGYNGIRSGDPYQIKPGESKNGPGPFFTNLSPDDLTEPGAFKKKLGVTNEKSQYVVELKVPKSRLVPLRGGRGAHVFSIPGGISVPRPKVRYIGPTSGWSAE